MDRVLIGIAKETRDRRRGAGNQWSPSFGWSVLFLALLWSMVNPLLAQSKVEDSGNVVVLELFTSEGCSSCPPADKLLSRLADEDQDRVFALAFHVDYWDYLGWKDPFGDPAFTKRQRQYGQALSPGRIYTPQLIVNGRHSLVGSDERAVRRALAGELNKKAVARLLFEDIDIRVDDLTCHVQASHHLAGTNLFLAVVEHDLDRHIRAGENRGRRLTSSHVVRALTKVKPDREGRGSLSLDLPENLNRDRANLIVWLQDQRNGQVLGASRHSLK